MKKDKIIIISDREYLSGLVKTILFQAKYIKELLDKIEKLEKDSWTFYKVKKMEKIRLTNEEIIYLRGALNHYCDDTTHPKKNGDSEIGLDKKSRESKVLEKVRKKLKEEKC